MRSNCEWLNGSGSRMSATRKSMLTPRAVALCRASEIIACERSNAVTCAPACANLHEYGPEPQPSSKTLDPTMSPMIFSTAGRSMLSENESSAEVKRSNASPHAFQVLLTSSVIAKQPKQGEEERRRNENARFFLCSSAPLLPHLSGNRITLFDSSALPW